MGRKTYITVWISSLKNIEEKENLNFLHPNLYAQIVCPSPNIWDFDEKGLHWVSVVRDSR